MSLTSCLKAAEDARTANPDIPSLDPKTRAEIFATAKALRKKGMDEDALAKKAVDAAIAKLEAAIAKEEAAPTPAVTVEDAPEVAATDKESLTVAPATHKDPGEPAEVATPAVVAEAIKTGVKATERKPSEMLADLMKQIDVAMATAPTAREASAAKRPTKDSFVSFDVPGDGKFKVVNTKESLDEFRKSASASPGFKDKGTPAPKQSRTNDKGELYGVDGGSGGASAAARAMLDDGEPLNALETLDASGKPMMFGNGAKDSAIPYTDATPTTIKGIDGFVGRGWSRKKGESSWWSFIHGASGFQIGEGGTKAEAISVATKVLSDEAKRKKLDDMIASGTSAGGGKFKSQDELRALFIEDATKTQQSTFDAQDATQARLTEWNKKAAARFAIWRSIMGDDAGGIPGAGHVNWNSENVKSFLNKADKQGRVAEAIQLLEDTAGDSWNAWVSRDVKAWEKAAQSNELSVGYGAPLDLKKPPHTLTWDEIEPSVRAYTYIPAALDRANSALRPWKEAHHEAIKQAIERGWRVPDQNLYQYPGLIRSDLNDDDADKAADAMVSAFKKANPIQRGGPNDYSSAVQAYRDWGKTPALDLMGFERIPKGNGAFELRDSNMRVSVEPAERGMYRASFGSSAKSGPRLTEQQAIEWAANIREESKKAEAAPAIPPGTPPIIARRMAAEQAAQSAPAKANADTSYYYVDGELGMVSSGSFTKDKARWAKFDATEAERLANGDIKPYGATRVGTFVGVESGSRLITTPKAATKPRRATSDQLSDATDFIIELKGSAKPARTAAEAWQRYQNVMAVGVRSGEVLIPEADFVDAWEQFNPAPAAPAAAEPVKAKEGEAKPGAVDNFGEKLPPARRAMAAKLDEDLADNDIATRPFSEIWPQAENDAIEDPFAAAVAHAARAEIPSKPRQSYKLKRWVEKVKMLRGLAGHVVGGRLTRERLTEEVKGQYAALKDWASKVFLLEKLPRDQWKRIGEVEERPNALTYADSNPVPRPLLRLTVDDKAHYLSGDGTVTGNMDAIRALLEPAAPEKRMEFEIRGPGPYKVNKKGDAKYRALGTFATVSEARDAITEYNGLVAAWEGVKASDNITERDLRTEENRPRAGKDWRQGKDVTPEQFQTQFGFKGGEFGKWVQQGKGDKERQALLNSTYDALMDLAQITGIPPRAISLNGTLGIAFGSRGAGWASAHFEPSNLVINLTKTRGAGALAHEWLHALDNYFSRQRGGEVPMSEAKTQTGYRDANYITHKPEPMMIRKDGTMGWGKLTKGQLETYSKTRGVQYAPDKWMPDPKHPAGVRPEVEQRFAALVNVLNDSPMTKRARELDETKTGEGYWSRTLERAARAFENYVQTRMHEDGYHNDFLANVRAVEDTRRNPGRYPYLLPGEIKPVADAFGALFDTIQTRTDEAGNVAMFSRAPGVKAALKRAIEAKSAFDVYDRKAVKVDDPETYFTLGQKLSDAKKALAAELMKQDDDGFVLQGRTWSDRMVIVNGSAQNAGQWQITRFDGNDEPWGDSQYRTKESALTDFLREVDLTSLQDMEGRFSRGKGRGVSMRDAEALKARIRAVLPNAPEMRLVESIDEVPPRLQEEIRKEGAEDDLEAVYYEGIVYGFPNHWESLERGEFVMGHHEIRHHGMRVLLMDKDGGLKALDAKLLELHRQNPALQRATQAIKAAGRAGQNETAKAIEEALADMPAEQVAALTGWDKFIAAIRDMLRAFARRLRNAGLTSAAKAIEPTAWTDRDVAAFVLQSEKVSGRGAGGARFSRAEANEPWYSALRRAVSGLGMGAAPAQGWKDTLKGMVAKGQVKADEIEWSGVNEWLGLQQGKVTKAQVQEYLDANGVKVTETLLGGGRGGAQAWIDVARDLRATGMNANKAEEIARAAVRGDEDAIDAAAAEGVEIEPLTGEGPAKYGQYQLPGGTNYREVLLTLPVKQRGEIPPGYRLIDEAEEARADGLNVPAGETGPWRFKGPSLSSRSYKTREEAVAAMLKDAKAEAENGIGLGDYRSGHWDQPNVLAHIRVNDRTDATGAKVLFVEEVQSDWGQAGKKAGFDDRQKADARKELEAEADTLRDESNEIQRTPYSQMTLAQNQRVAAIRARLSEINNSTPLLSKIPAAPFVTATDKWVALALKRIVKMAVDGGYDKVAFVTGTQSADRYDLSKQITSLAVYRDGAGFKVSFTALNSGTQPAVQVKDADALADTIGKDLAQKAIADLGERRSMVNYAGLDLKVGGEGMRAFYDKIIPAATKEVLRKLGGGAMESVQIAEWFDGTNEEGRRVMDAEPTGDTMPQPGFTITPAMREKAARGLPMFSRPTTLAERRAASPVAKLNSVLRGAGWEVEYIDLDLTGDKPKADIRIKRDDGRFLIAKVDSIGRASFETFQRERNLRMDQKNPQSRLSPHIDDTFLGRQRFDGARSMLRTMTQYLTDNATTPVALADMRSAFAGVMAAPTKQDLLSAPDGTARFSRAAAPGMAQQRQGPQRLSAQDLVNAKGGVFDFNRLGETKQDRIRTVIDASRPGWLGLLTRDQIADVYGAEIPPVKEYDQLTRLMENERSKIAQDADDLYSEWAKIPAEQNDTLARVMLDATVFGVDPDGDFTPGKPNDAERQQVHARIKEQFDGMSPEARAMYGKVKDYHLALLNKLREALEARIQRQVESGATRAAALTKIREAFDSYLGSGPYFPLSRFGDFLVVANREEDGERVVASYATSGEQAAAARVLESDGFTVKLKTAKTYSRETDGSAGKFIGDVLMTLDKLDMSEATVGGNAENLKAKLMDDVNQLFIRALPDLSYRKHFMHRKGTPGFSSDMMRGFASSAFHAASHIARLNHADQMTFALQDAYTAIEQAPEGDFNLHSQVLNELTKRHDASLNPNTHPVAAMLNQVGFVMYLGLSPAAGLVNMLQTVMVTMPHLGARYGFGKANSTLAAALSDIMGAKANTKNGWNAAQSPKLSAEERAMMTQLQEEGVIDLTQAHDLASATGLDTGNVARSKAAFAMARAMKIVGWTFHIPEVMNRQVTALAAYRLEMRKSGNAEAAADAAREAIKRTHFDYSQSNRARFMQGNLARVVTQFKQYSQNMTYLLGRAMHQALKGESPEVRAIARRQLLATVGVTWAMAGALGLPGLGAVGGLIGILVGALGDDEEPWEWKVELRNLLADQFGKETAEVLSHGIPRALMPWDISNRVSLGDLWWRDNGREGQSPREAFASDMANILGPTAGTALGLYTMADHAAKGNWSKAAESIVPKFLRDPLKAIREGSDGVTSGRGEPLMDVTAAEVTGRLLGFAPARVSEMYEGKGAVMNAKTAIEEKRQMLVGRMAKARLDRDAEAAAELSPQIAAFNERNPEFRITLATIAKSMRAKAQNRARTDEGILLPRTKENLREIGRFAVTQ